MSDSLILHKGLRVKSVEGGFVEGLLVPFTSPEQRDAHGEYFDANTELSFDLLGAPVLLHHGHVESVDGVPVGRTPIGKFVEAKVTDAGVWVRAQLDMLNSVAQKVYALAKQGLLAWSSGAAPSALVDSTGYIRYWPVIEGSLTDNPAMPGITRITAKSLQESSASLEELLSTATEGGERGEVPQVAAAEFEKTAGAQSGYQKGSMMDNVLGIVAAIAKRMNATLTGDDLVAIANEVSGAAPADAETVEGADEIALADPARNAPVKAAAEKLGAIALDRIRVMSQEKAAARWGGLAEAAVNAPAQRNPAGSPRTEVGGTQVNPATSGGTPYGGGAPVTIAHQRIKARLGNLSPERISFGLDMNNLLSKMRSDVRVKFAPSAEDQQTATNLAKAVFMAHAAEQFEKGLFEMPVEHYEKAVSAATHFSKANEIDNTGQTGYGAEWVPEAWAPQIWARARRENVVLSRIGSFEMNAPIVNWPTDGADGEVVMVSQHTDVGSFNDPVTAANVSKLPTAEVVFNTNGKKLQRQILWTREELEDSVIKFDSQADSQAMQSMIDALESVVLNGDTETGTTNINYDDGTPASNKAYLIWDGVIKYALANTGVDMGSDAPTLRKFIEMLYKMDPEIAGDEKDTVIFTHSPVYGKLIQMDEFVTYDVVGGPGGNTSGRIPSIAGVPVLRTQQMAKSATNGKINDTAGVNLYGRAVGVYLPYWKLGYRRRIGRKLAEAGDGESFLLTMTARASFKQHGSALGAGLLYNIGV